MSQLGKNFDDCLAALQSDLPDQADEMRVRAKLLAAGVLAGGVASAAHAGASTSVEAAAALAPKVGVFGKVLGASGLPKVILLASGVSMASAPFVYEVARSSFGGHEVIAPRAANPEIAVRPPIQSEESGPAEEALRDVPPPPEGEPNSAIDSVARAPSSDGEQSRLVAGSPGSAARSGAKPPPLEHAFDPEARSTREEQQPSAMAGQLRAETALLEQALLALRGGDLGQARKLLLEHRRRFPQGSLAREREKNLERLASETQSSP